ncbi:hypothetical protein [Mycolicibacterium madagascariense]|uniref:hypothetical protein n=1 Tax=Mycolicibacterium madagascariense TaxID=212765 RepID=UPI0013D11BA1|nr:hypothetical protein [Mycolicibacterium madagascariense]MCV7015102.1 hypothetical protein [Mycolicibacterium madagascariense]
MSKNSKPGEVNPEKGRKRAKLFAACLQKIIAGFTAEYFVEKHPEKLRFDIASDDERALTFDIQGRLVQPGYDGDIWIESKGYDKSLDLLEHYREFLKTVALARLRVDRISKDQFWFVSSAPFACNVGSQLTSAQWIRESLLKSSQEEKTNFFPGEFDALEKQTGFVGMANSIKVMFLTAPLMRATGLAYFVKQNDNLWDLTVDLYGGEFLLPDYAPYVQRVAAENRLSDPDFLQVNQMLNLPFVDWPDQDEGQDGVLNSTAAS